MFRRRSSRTALFERLLGEKDTQLRILVAEIDWLRAQLGRPSLPAVISPGHTLLDGKAAELGHATWESELDEAQAILDKNELSRIHLDEILDGLGVGSSDLS